MIELSAPQPFPYADYYNNYLFVSTVGLCMGTLQPIILPVTAFYLAMDCVFKKYLLQYVFFSKTESGGRFWKLLVNRMLFAVLLANAVIALVVGARGVGDVNIIANGDMLYTMIPLPIILAGFKWYCKRSYDDKLLYYSTSPYSDLEGSQHPDHPKSRRNMKVSSRYGHPALYKKLLTPMVHAKSQHLLKEIYSNRSTAGHDIFEEPNRRSTDRARPATLGYGDMFEMEEPHKPSDVGQDMPNMEFVAEDDLDFENFKKRAEFREQFGGDGELYGRPDDLSSRPGTPSTFTTFTDTGPYRIRDTTGSGASSRRSSMTRLGDVGDEQGTLYAKGYQQASPRDDFVDVSIPATPLDTEEVLRAGNSRQPLVDPDERGDDGGAGYFGRSLRHEETSYDRFRGMR